MGKRLSASKNSHKQVFLLLFYIVLTQDSYGLGKNMFQEERKWLNTSMFMSVIRRLVVYPRSVLLALTIHYLSVCYLTRSIV